ncbi:MAG: DUF2142 domain-containing protein [Chloroflexi bacterium]|nr:DUF2142 domain-containing protein [Chloroflexota bacterium]
MNRSLAILLAAYLLIGLVYASSTPIFEASDEIWHYAVVREIVTNRRLPVQELDRETRWEQEGSQPPLYYLLGAALTWPIDIRDYESQAILNPFVKAGAPGATDNINLVAHPPGQSPRQGGTVLAVHLIRWLSLLMGAGAVYFTYRLARSVYPAREALALLAAAFVAFNPMILFINASVNNDNLLMLLSVATLWLLVEELRAEDDRPRWPRMALLAILIGLAMLTKVSGAVLAPTAGIALTLRAWKEGRWDLWWRRGLLLALTAAGMAGWWFWRNQTLYGEWLGIERMALIAGQRPAGFGLSDLISEWSSFWYSYWGVFGAFNLLAPDWFFALVGWLSALAGLGALVRLAWRLKARRWASWPVHVALLSYPLLSAIGLVRWSLLTSASQGRLLFGAAAVTALYAAVGLLFWVPRAWRKGATRLLALGFALIALSLPFLVIRPAYRPPEPIAALPDDAIPLAVRFGDSIQLVGYRLERPVVQAGAPLDFTLYWLSEQPIAQNYDLSLNGLGYRFENVAKLDTWPGGGLLPTSLWQPGRIYPDRYQLPTSALAQTPTLVQLSVQFSQDLLNNGRVLPVFDGEQLVNNLFLDVSDLVSAPEQMTRATTPLLAQWQAGAQLRDYELTLTNDGRALALDLTWTTTQPLSADYTIFVHLQNAQGQTLAQGDAPPREGFWPTSHWRVGEAVESWHRLPLPESEEDYRILLGLYDPRTLQRLSGSDAQGRALPDGAFVIPVEVERMRRDGAQAEKSP